MLDQISSARQFTRGRYDHDETGYTYGGSFPFLKAVDGLGEVLLAYEMNGEDLPRDHGYPVRLVIPGHVGARQVKWLRKLKLSNEPSKKSYQAKSYLGFAPDVTFEKDLAHWPPARLDQVRREGSSSEASRVLRGEVSLLARSLFANADRLPSSTSSR